MSEEHAEVEVVAVEKVEAEYNKDIWIRTLAYLYGVEEVGARKIMECESSMYSEAVNRNLREDGSTWSIDVGPWQINDYYHEKQALSMGLDIYDEKDNIEYGFWLFSIEGAGPWSASRHCHGMS